MTPDICQSNHGRADTSVAAYEWVRDSLPAARQRVFELIEAAEPFGLTCDQVEQLLQKPHQSVSARMTELKRDGHIVDSRKRRPTRTGSTARVYVVNQPERQLDLELRA